MTERIAIAEGAVTMAPATLALIRAGNAKKGDVHRHRAHRRHHGRQAHPRADPALPSDRARHASSVEIEPDDALPGLRVRATTKVAERTGVEMEALTAVSVACLTIYDMAKAVDRGMDDHRHPPRREARRPLRHLACEEWPARCRLRPARLTRRNSASRRSC